MEDWNALRVFVEKMKNTSSVLEKKEILKTSNMFVQLTLAYTYNPYKKYNVTSKNCKKNNQLKRHRIENTLFELLDQLHKRVYTGHAAIHVINAYIDMHCEYSDLIYSIIDRNLEIRASESIINSVFPNLIPTFDVALAHPYEPKLCKFDQEVWYASRKLDGVRCIVYKQGDSVIAYSRQGKEFTTLQTILDQVSQISGDFVLDGEICLMNADDTEDFQSIMKEIKKKDHTIQDPRYILFDCLTVEDFENKKSSRLLSERLQVLTTFPSLNSGRIRVLEQEKVNDEGHLLQLSEIADQKGHEGVMVRKDSVYEGKRTKSLLKCKKFFEAEYQVKDVDFDNHRVVRDGKEVVIPMMAQVWIEHKDCKVAVGSGWSQEQRIYYHNHPEQILQKIITVRYFEETQNQHGGYSLRFPTIKIVHGETRET